MKNAGSSIGHGDLELAFVVHLEPLGELHVLGVQDAAARLDRPRGEVIRPDDERVAFEAAGRIAHGSARRVRGRGGVQVHDAPTIHEAIVDDDAIGLALDLNGSLTLIQNRTGPPGSQWIAGSSSIGSNAARARSPAWVSVPNERGARNRFIVQTPTIDCAVGRNLGSGGVRGA